MSSGRDGGVGVRVVPHTPVYMYRFISLLVSKWDIHNIYYI